MRSAVRGLRPERKRREVRGLWPTSEAERLVVATCDHRVASSSASV
jgi:hypothetical protein